MMRKKDNRGGAREGAGAPLKYGEETVMFRKRVPKSKKKAIEKLVEDYLKQYEVIYMQTEYHKS